MKKNIVKLILLALIIILILILISIYFIKIKKDVNDEVPIIYEDIILDDEKELFEVDNTIFQTKSDANQIEDIDFDLVIEIMASDDNIDYIIDNEEAIKLKIKEYILANNIQHDVTTATYETYQRKKNSDMIAVLFALDDIKETELIVVIDKNHNEINVKEK